MKILLIGYGKMGKEIHQLASQRGHEIVKIIDLSNKSAISDLNKNSLRIDMAIEFTNPLQARVNVSNCLKAGIPVVCGTTGWNKDLEKVKNLSHDLRVGFIQSSNFSIGMNIVFRVNNYLANLVNVTNSYIPKITETHHIQKLDKPSGTAITLAEQIIQNMDSISDWSLGSELNDTLSIEAIRLDKTPGTHVINYKSDFDEIEIIHRAKSRKGFAMGAIIAAEFLLEKKGVYEIREVMNSLFQDVLIPA